VDLVADENIDAGIVVALRAAGHSVIYVRELEPGIDDDRVLRLANERGALLVTSDKDFGELAFRQYLVHAGVILIRLAGLSIARKREVVLTVLRAHGSELSGAFTVVGPASLRIRRRPAAH
jgi:predicted nuclease of predicted toxin-antitoxin system